MTNEKLNLASYTKKNISIYFVGLEVSNRRVDMDYDSLKYIVPICGFLTTSVIAYRQICIARINKNQKKKFWFKNNHIEVITEGDITKEEVKLIKDIFDSKAPNKQLKD